MHNTRTTLAKTYVMTEYFGGVIKKDDRTTDQLLQDGVELKALLKELRTRQ